MKSLKESKPLTQAEKLFCLYYARLQNPREAATRAGFTNSPEETGEQLLQKRRIRTEIDSILSTEADENTILAGYKRLAFGSIADALKLVALDEVPLSEIEKLDLFNIAEIKKPRAGALEIKFFDRMHALEKLEEYTAGKETGGTAFYKALENSAKALAKEEEEDT